MPFRMILGLAVVLSLSIGQALASNAAGQETLVGIVGSDFVLLGADSSLSQSIALTGNLDKIAVVLDRTLIAAAGDAADTDRLVNTIQAHARIREYEEVGGDVHYVDCRVEPSVRIKSPTGLSVEALAYLARYQIGGQLRTRAPLRANLLIAGLLPWSEETNRSGDYLSKRLQAQVRQLEGGHTSHKEPKVAATTEPGSPRPCLFWLDEYGSIREVPYGAHGYASNFLWSILDEGYRPDLTLDEAESLMRRCFAQLRERYVINSPQEPCIKCVDKHGCRVLPPKDLKEAGKAERSS